MFQVTKKAEYGLRAMIILAKGFKPTNKNKQVVLFSVKSISEKENISFDFLEKIISQLEKAKLVKGIKGVNGGYSLATSPSNISVRDILNALEGFDRISNCPFCPRNKKCIAKSAWLKINASLAKTLEGIKLSQLVK